MDLKNFPTTKGMNKVKTFHFKKLLKIQKFYFMKIKKFFKIMELFPETNQNNSGGAGCKENGKYTRV